MGLIWNDFERDVKGTVSKQTWLLGVSPVCSCLFSPVPRLGKADLLSSPASRMHTPTAQGEILVHPATPRQFAGNLLVTFGSLREVFLFSGLHVCCRFLGDLANAVFCFF